MASEDTTSLVHYICQTYLQETTVRSENVKLKIGKQFKYNTASEAKERTEREFRSPDCIGADAYMITEELESEEVGEPVFLIRLGTVPEI